MPAQSRRRKARLTDRVFKIMKGFGDIYPDEDLPFYDFYVAARDYHWTWAAYLATPPLVMSYLGLYASVEAGVRAQAAQAGAN